MSKTKVLFLCTGNSCRSQMAEGWSRHLHGDKLEVASAGIIKHGVDPRAVQVMLEAGLDITRQSSKAIYELPEQSFDAVITLCDHASESCPFFPGDAIRLHQGFDDPPALARQASSQEEALGGYRRVRDEIRDFVQELPQSLEEKQQK